MTYGDGSKYWEFEPWGVVLAMSQQSSAGPDTWQRHREALRRLFRPGADNTRKLHHIRLANPQDMRAVKRMIGG